MDLCGLALAAVADLVESVEGGVVRVGEGVQIALRRGDVGVTESLFDDLEVGTAGEQPRGVACRRSWTLT